MMLDTPVLFLIFNRPENTREVFEGIRKARPKKLFIAADGPRDGKEGELEICRQTRRIATSVDWDCEVNTLFRDNNLGCKRAVSLGINWFFEQVEYGIILEDDCKPGDSFFEFCEEMLSYYRHDLRVMMVCGTNYLPHDICSKVEDSYFFARYYPIWGWATWKRAWELYDVDIKKWDKFRDSKQLSWLFSHPEISEHYEFMFNLIENGFDTWDIQWWYACIFNSGLAVIPKYNLISNIGVIGTHSNTQGNYSINMPTYTLERENIKHPDFIFPDKVLNEWTYKLSHAQVDVISEKRNDLAVEPVKNISFNDVVKYFAKKLLP